MSLDNQHLKDHWEKRRQVAYGLREDGKCSIQFVKVVKHWRIHVIAPLSDKFKDRALVLEGRYRRKSSVWTFAPQQYVEVLTLCRQVYGAKNVVEGRM